jgi:hypothetical protein
MPITGEYINTQDRTPFHGDEYEYTLAAGSAMSTKSENTLKNMFQISPEKSLF